MNWGANQTFRRSENKLESKMARRERIERLETVNCNRKLRFAESLTRFKSLQEAKTRSSGRKWNGGDGGT
jgi:hypothetical protein